MMIVKRIVWGIKKGRADEAVALLRQESAAESARGGYSGTSRFYVLESEDLDRVSVEYEYADLEACNRHWRTWRARPTTPAFLEAWHELRDGAETNENWTVPD
jgi:hypothetical protein